MPRTPDDPQHEEKASFFKRWSDRKTEAATQPAVERSPEDTSVSGAPEGTAAADIDATPETADAPPPVTEADLENLTYESDYTKFMGEHVPEALRRRALRQLWRSDPILANLDGLCDYDDDFTDAALAVKVLETAHQVGQGYLTDEEVAANQARGNPADAQSETEEASAEEDVLDDTEDFEDEDDDDESEAKEEIEVMATASQDDIKTDEVASTSNAGPPAKET